MFNFLSHQSNEMQFIYVAVISFAIIYFVNFIFKKNNILLDNISFSKHKSFTNKNSVPLSGGTSIIFVYFIIYFNLNLLNSVIFFLIFLVGILSDNNKLSSPKIRFLLQFAVILLFIKFNGTTIESLRISFLDDIITSSEIFSIFFTAFCLSILINGSNFIDGLNLQSSGYFISVLLALMFNNYYLGHLIDLNLIINLLAILVVFIIYNFFSKSFFGDSGIYLISFIVGIIAIEFVSLNENMSPYFIALLLWYPAFENLFTITRRFINKKKILKPDNKHLHHYIFKKLSKIFKKKNKYIISSLSGLMINFFNICIFLIGSQFIYSTKNLILLIFFSIIVYLSTYIFLARKQNE